MNILAFNGSPKGEKSNTLKLTKAFIEGIKKQNNNAKAEIIDLTKTRIDECMGCFSCWSKTPGECVIHDDMNGIIRKIIDADIIIWSFPLYHFSVPAKLKALMDRQLPMCLPFMTSDSKSGGHPSRYEMKEQRHVLISTCGFYTAKGNYESVNAMFDRMFGKNKYTAIYCGQGELFRVPQLKERTDWYLSVVEQAGTEFAGGIIKADTRNKLNTLLYPREVFENMADASWGVEKTETGEEKKSSKAASFTRQMASLYNKNSWDKKDLVLEFEYTDVNERYQIVMGKDGHTVLTENFLDYTTKIETPLSVWERIAVGDIGGEQALMEHLYSVQGDFKLMMNWDKYFGVSGEITEEKSSVPKKKSIMSLLIIPWMAIWIGIAINSFSGSVAGIAVCAVLQLAYLKFKPTIYEHITTCLVSAICILSLLDVSSLIIIPLSYLCFGLMWTISAFLKIPLTAHYSMYNHGGDKAWKNPLFIQTNRILTACWGILYIITSIWTFFMMTSSLSDYIVYINNSCPILLGIFTAWFQNWYPKHYAQGK